MKNLIIAALLGCALTACGNAADSGSTVKEASSQVASEASMMAETKTKAVLIYADWCSSCKVLDPAVKKVQAMGPLPGAEFVVLDYTDKDETNFYAQADAAGVEAAIRTYLGDTIKTGQLLLVDVDDEVVIKKITKEDTAPVILTKIKDAVKAS